MSQHLPDHFDPWRFADRAKRLNGSYALADLPRLGECLADHQGDAHFDLQFYRDKRQRACVEGKVEASLVLECQRCLGRIQFDVNAVVSIGFVEGLDEAEQLPEELDPQLVEEGQVVLRNLIEDELLLALPQVAMHPDGDCVAPGDEARDEPVAQKQSPFAVLAQLKRHDE